MVNSLMPSWALVLLTVAYLLVLAVHLRHLLEVRGQARAWHVVHVLMALGMVNMAVPTAWTGLSGMPLNATIVGYTFAVVALFCAAMTGSAVRDRDRVASLWALLTVGAVGMAWMYRFVGRDGWFAVGTVVFALWFTVEAVLWATGVLTSRVHALEGADGGAAASTAVGAGSSVPTAQQGALVTAEHVQTRVQITHEHSRVARATLAVMALGMAWMLIAMQFGAPPAGMSGMDGMSHHHHH